MALSIKTLIEIMILLVLGAAITPTINSACFGAWNNSTGVAQIAWGLAPFIFGIVIFSGIAAYAYMSFRK
jgi:hypothetical protein